MKAHRLSDHELGSIFAIVRAKFEAEWLLLDDILADVCRTHPHHESRSAVNAKLYLIGRSFASGIERLIRSDRKQGSALRQLADVVTRNSSLIDRSIARLPRCPAEDLPDEAFTDVVAGHRDVLKAIRPLLRDGRAARSFVSKYLHFHCDAVPIYDSVVIKNRPSFVRSREVPRAFAAPRGADEHYHDYVLCVRWLYRRLHGLGANPKVRLVEWMMSRHAGEWGG